MAEPDPTLVKVNGKRAIDSSELCIRFTGNSQVRVKTLITKEGWKKPFLHVNLTPNALPGYAKNILAEEAGIYPACIPHSLQGDGKGAAGRRRIRTRQNPISLESCTITINSQSSHWAFATT